MEQINIDCYNSNTPYHKKIRRMAVRMVVLAALSFGGCYYRTVEFTSLEELASENPKILSAVDKQKGNITFDFYGARYRREGGSITVLSVDGDTFRLESQKIDKLITSKESGEQFDEDRLPALASALLHMGNLIFADNKGFFYNKEKNELICRTDRDLHFLGNISEIKEFYYKRHSFISPEELNEENLTKVKKVVVMESAPLIDVKKIWHDRGIEYITGVSTESEKILIPKENLISFKAEVPDVEETTLVWVASVVIVLVIAVLLKNEADRAFTGWSDWKLTSPVNEHAQCGSSQ